MREEYVREKYIDVLPAHLSPLHNKNANRQYNNCGNEESVDVRIEEKQNMRYD